MEPSVADHTEGQAPGVDQAARELRQAIMAADHVLAERACSHYVAALQTLWEALPGEERGRSSIPAKACELLVWAREMTLIQRSLAADQLRILQKASRYQNARDSHVRLQLKG